MTIAILLFLVTANISWGAGDLSYEQSVNRYYVLHHKKTLFVSDADIFFIINKLDLSDFEFNNVATQI